MNRTANAPTTQTTDRTAPRPDPFRIEPVSARLAEPLAPATAIGVRGNEATREGAKLPRVNRQLRRR